MTQRQRDALLLAAAAVSLYSLYQLRKVERAAAAAAHVLTLDPTSAESLKKRLIDRAIDLPLDFITP